MYEARALPKVLLHLVRAEGLVQVVRACRARVTMTVGLSSVHRDLTATVCHSWPNINASVWKTGNLLDSLVSVRNHIYDLLLFVFRLWFLFFLPFRLLVDKVCVLSRDLLLACLWTVY